MPPPEEERSWLDDLQRESWQLELLISGFAVFLLLGAWGSLLELADEAFLVALNLRRYIYLVVLVNTLSVTTLALLLCLVIHVALRGIWIGAIGLRSVSGVIDYDRLDYRPRFRRFLERTVGDFDRYIDRLEQYSSVLFSLAFLVIFCLISLSSYLTVINLLAFALSRLFGGDTGGGMNWGLSDQSGLALLLLLPGLLYLLDFLTLGLFKRQRWIAVWYYPIYRFMGWITLARFYRPIYHNLIDERLGRRLARLIPVFVMLLCFGMSLIFVQQAYLPQGRSSYEQVARAYQYDDEGGPGPVQLRWHPALRSKYPTGGYVELFVPYLGQVTDPVIERLHPGLEPGQRPGVWLGRPPITIDNWTNREADPAALLRAVTGAFRLRIDGRRLAGLTPRFYDHPTRGLAGLRYLLPVNDYPPGEHRLVVSRRRIRGDSLEWDDLPALYFYR